MKQTQTHKHTNKLKPKTKKKLNRLVFFLLNFNFCFVFCVLCYNVVFLQKKLEETFLCNFCFVSLFFFQLIYLCVLFLVLFLFFLFLVWEERERESRWVCWLDLHRVVQFSPLLGWCVFGLVVACARRVCVGHFGCCVVLLGWACGMLCCSTFKEKEGKLVWFGLVGKREEMIQLWKPSFKRLLC